MYFAHVNGNELKVIYGVDFTAGSCQSKRNWEWHVLSHPSVCQGVETRDSATKKRSSVGVRLNGWMGMTAFICI